MRLGEIQGHLNVLEMRLNDHTQRVLLLKGEREQLKTMLSRMQIKVGTMAELEAKLDA